MPGVQGHTVGKDECFLLSQWINESLKLSLALHGTRNLEGLSSEHWQLIATWDFQKRTPASQKWNFSCAGLVQEALNVC